MAAVPSLGRASTIDAGSAAPEADLTRALYEQYAAQIFRYCLHQLGSREEAEDAVQSTFLNAFRGIKRGIVPELESAWLFKIAHNVCLSRRRSTWRRGKIEAPADFDVVEELAPAPSRRADELIGLQDVLEQMPEQQRRAILLREWQGLSYREIGEELDLSQAAVETLIFRARRSLAQGLEQPETVRKRKQRLGAGVLGNLLSSAQSYLVGGSAAAVKVAATVAVVSAGTVVATAPAQHQHAKPQHPKAAPAKKTPAVRAATTSPHAPTAAGTVAPAAHAARRSLRKPAVPTTGPAATPVFDDGGAPAAATTVVEAPPAPAAAPAPQPPAPAPTPPDESAHTAPVVTAPPALTTPFSHDHHDKTNAPSLPTVTTTTTTTGAVPSTPFDNGRDRVDHRRKDDQVLQPQPVTLPTTTTSAPTTPTTNTTTTTTPTVSAPPPAASPPVLTVPSDHGRGNDHDRKP